MARLLKCPRPDSEEEILNTAWYVHHNCGPARALKPVLGPDVDLLQFSVGIFGAGMPLDVPFEVRSSNDCSACGKQLRVWAQWTGQKIWVP